MRQRLGDMEGIVLGLINLGRVSLQQNNLDIALSYFHQSCELSETSGLQQWYSYAMGKIGYVAMLQNDYHQSYRHYELAAKAAMKTRSLALQLEILAGTAILRKRQGENISIFLNVLCSYNEMYDETRSMLAEHIGELAVTASSEVWNINQCFQSVFETQISDA
jgi:hypothetical protein